MSNSAFGDKPTQSPSKLHLVQIGTNKSSSPKLSNIQTAALDIIEWLIDDSIRSRQSGRSTLLAVAFIRKAIRRPKRKVVVFDHYPTMQAKESLMANIQQMIRTSSELRNKFILESNSITFTYIYKKGERRFL